MPLVRKGRDLIADVFTACSTGIFTTSGAVIWVGSSTAAHGGAQTHLQSTNTGAGYEGGGDAATMETGYPLRGSSGRMTFRAIFTTCEADYQWSEWGIKNSTTTGDYLFNRFADSGSLGIKTTDQTWQITADLDLTT